MKDKGFTLVELMIAAAILAIVLVGLLAVFTGCFVLNETARNLTIAINGAQKKVEQIRNEDFGTIIANYNGPFNISDLDGKGRVDTSYVAGSNNNLIEVRVVICWRQKGGRIIGEARDVIGDLIIVDLDGDGNIASPAQIVTLMTRR